MPHRNSYNDLSFLFRGSVDGCKKMILFLQNNENLFCRTPLLWQILRTCPNTKVVFSTTWRDSYNFEYMLDFVTYGGGEDLSARFVGSIPNLESEGRYGRRDLEIQRWLDTNNHAGPWLALDDMVELFSGVHPNLFVCDGTLERLVLLRVVRCLPSNT